jgi:hypothetical protein
MIQKRIGPNRQERHASELQLPTSICGGPNESNQVEPRDFSNLSNQIGPNKVRFLPYCYF